MHSRRSTRDETYEPTNCSSTHPIIHPSRRRRKRRISLGNDQAAAAADVD